MPSASDSTHGLRALHVLAPMREGGLERVVTMMAASQKLQGVRVAAVLEPADVHEHPFVRRLTELDIPVSIIGVNARAYREEFRDLKRLIQLEKPQVVHTHGYRADVIAAAAARACGVPTVSTVHGFTGGGVRNKTYEFIQLRALRRADAVIAVSAAMIERLVRAGISKAKIHFVANGFVAASEPVDRSTARRKLGLPDDHLIAGWVGRLSREKGADVILDALASADPAWYLSVLGEGPESLALRARAARLGIAHRITWHGAVPEAASLLKAFDAFVLSSRTEGTPIALFEAMNAGVPIVATSVGGVPAVVNAEHAVLVPPEEPRLIAAALETINNNRVQAGERTQLARRRLEAFSHDVWLSAVDRIYTMVLEKAE